MASEEFLAKTAFTPLKNEIEKARDDAENHAQSLTSFTDVNGDSFDKGSRGWSEDAEDFADISIGSANFKGDWSDLSGSLDVPATVRHDDTIWLLINDLADVTTSEPSEANSDWESLSITRVTNSPPFNVDSISGLIDLNTGTFTKAVVSGFYSDTPWGFTRLFEWDSTQDQSNHDGWSVINPDHLSTIGSANWYSSVGDGTDDTGTGCWVRDVNSSVNILEAGAKGDNSNDDTFAFESAASVVDKVYFPDGQYVLESGIDVGVKDTFSIEGESYNTILDFSQTAVASGTPFALTIKGETTQIANLNADVNEDDQTVEFASAHGLSENDMFFIHNTADGSFNPARTSYRDGEICVVKSVDSTTQVTLTTPILSNYDISADTIEVYKCTPVFCNLENFSYIVNDDYKGFLIDKSRDSNIENVRVTGGGFSRLYLKNSLSATVDNINMSQGYNAPSNNYAVYLDGCQNCKVDNSVIEGETSIDFGGASDSLACNRRNKATGNVLIGRLTAHGNQDQSEYHNNTVIGATFLRGGTSVFKNNIAYGNLAFGELVEFDHSIEDNTFILYESVSGTNTAINSSDVDLTNIKKDGVFKFNRNRVITNGYSSGMRVNFTNESTSTAKINLEIKGNECDASLTIGEQYHPQITLSDNDFSNFTINPSFDVMRVDDNNIVGGKMFIDMLNPALLSDREEQILKLRDNYCVTTDSGQIPHKILSTSSGVSGDDIKQIVYINGKNYFKTGPSPTTSSASQNAILVITSDEVHVTDAILRANDLTGLVSSLSVYDTDDFYTRNVDFESGLDQIRNSATNSYRTEDELRNAGDPNGSVTAEYPGRLCLDTTNDIYYISTGTGTDWEQFTPLNDSKTLTHSNTYSTNPSVGGGTSPTFNLDYTKDGNWLTGKVVIDFDDSSSVAEGDRWLLSGLPFDGDGANVVGNGQFWIYSSLVSNNLATGVIGNRGDDGLNFIVTKVFGSIDYTSLLRGTFKMKIS